MKKVVLFSLCAAAVLASCNNAGQNKDALKLQNDSLMIELSNRDAELSLSGIAPAKKRSVR